VVKGYGFRVEGSGLKAKGLKVYRLWFRVSGRPFIIQGR
jgi:hypothetical protein